MTREQAKELLPVIEAFIEGKQIQFRAEANWLDTPNITDIDTI